MAKDNKFFDDFSKLAGSTFASMVNMKNEFSKLAKEQVKASLRSMDFVSRNEFNALKHMASQMRKELDELKSGSKAKPVAKKTSVSKGAVKKTVTKKIVTKKAPARKATASKTKKK